MYHRTLTVDTVCFKDFFYIFYEFSSNELSNDSRFIDSWFIEVFSTYREVDKLTNQLFDNNVPASSCKPLKSSARI